MTEWQKREMAGSQWRITLPDGRSLGYGRFGNPSGPPVVYSHGFPASRLEAGLLSEAADRAGVQLIAPDRPGFGLSEFQPGRRILDWATDIASLADQLGFAQFRLLGGSAGCPYALACAHRLQQRILRVGIIGGLGPTDEKEAVGRMSKAARLGFFLARRTPLIFKFAYGGLGQLVARYPSLAYRLNEATGPDRELLARPQVRSILDASIQEAFCRGTAGALHEFSLLALPWGFDLEGISVPLDIWHGRQDGVVPHAMGELLAEKAPNGRLHLIAGEGHVSLPVRRGVEILETLCQTG